MAEDNDDSVVFTINDIDLRIAPESISVQQEDLVYSWRTLRTRASTKIPSGHGQTLVQVRIPFMDSDILALHRLIIEFRHSPFCFVENLYLRQVLCSEWPLFQLMAFTMTSLDVVPYPGTTNAWIVNLEMTWFNYFPYVHNWLYRRDWTTDWISSKTDKGEPYNIKLTIGWDINEDGVRSKPRQNIIEEKAGNPIDGSHREWSSLNDSYIGKSLTIQDLEMMHKGEVFDLLPLPTMMKPSAASVSPGESLIYKRYINFLQRDALMKNFGINVEQLIGYAPGAPTLFSQALFGKLTVRGDSIQEFVHPLHKRELPTGIGPFPEVQAEWNSYYNSMIQQILSHKQGIELGFCTYRNVQLPGAIAATTAALVKKANTSSIPDNLAAANLTSSWAYSDSGRKQKLLIRNGLSQPGGFHTPVGNFDSTKRNFDTLCRTIKDDVHWRNQDEGVKGRRAGYHYGLDISSDEQRRGIAGTPVYAVKDGTVVEFENGYNSPMTRWKYITISDSKVTDRGSAKDKLGDFALTLDAWSKKYHSDRLHVPVGTVVQSVGEPERYYYVDFGTGGRYLGILHEGKNEFSRYMHLSWIDEKLGRSGTKDVKAGQLIGTIGGSYTLTEDFVAANVKYGDLPIPESQNPEDGADEIAHTKISRHLHFEFYEKSTWYPDREKASDTNPSWTKSQGQKPGWTVVNAVPTFKWARDTGYTTTVDAESSPQGPTIEEVKSQIVGEQGMSDEDKNALIASLDAMYEAGYYYYDRQADVNNVWWKPTLVTVRSVNPEYPDYDQVIQTDTAVLTNITGGLRHIVANIPILGHEFPTQQHLGSVEPYYNLEFHMLDDTGTLEGQGERSGFVSGIRALLQHNSRKFRLIPDSWCLYTDSFLTRLLGTLQISDHKVAYSQEDRSVVSDFILNRRTIVSRAQHDTIEGNPGLSKLLWEIQETNPYTNEALEVNAPALQDIEDARKKILKAIHGLDLIPDYKELAVQLLIAQSVNANTSLPGEKDFGRFQLASGVNYSDAYYIGAAPVPEQYATTANGKGLMTPVEPPPTQERMFMIRDEGSVLMQALKSNGIPVVSFNGRELLPQESHTQEAKITDETALGIPASVAGLDKYAEQTYTEGGVTYTVYDISELISSSQKNLLLAEIPMDKIQILSLILKKIELSAEMYVSEESSMLTSGVFQGAPLTKQEVRDLLYDLPIEPSLHRLFQTFLINTAARWYWPNFSNLGIGIGPTTISNSAANILTNKAQVTLALESNPNWLVWNKEARDISAYSSVGIGTWVTYGFNVVGAPLAIGLEVLKKAWHVGGQTLGIASAQLNGKDKSWVSYWATNYNSNALSINNNIAKNYAKELPLIALSASDQIKDILEDTNLGNLLGGILSDTGLPVIMNTQTRLANAVISSGHFGPHPWLGDIPFFLQPYSQSDDTSWFKEFLVYAGALPERTGSTDGSVFLAGEDGQTLVAENSTQGSLNYTPKEIPLYLAALKGLPTAAVVEPLEALITSNDEWFRQTGLPLPGSPFQWQVDRGIELEKVRYFKRLLAQLADSAMQNPGVLRAFGLEELSNTNRRNIVKGKEAYPDLELPPHPYYGNSYAVYPDFYMWNMYDDGDAHNSGMRKDVSNSMGTILENCYKSMNRLQRGEKAVLNKSDQAIGDPAVDSIINFNIKYQAEAKGGMANPFYPTDETKDAISDYFNGVASETPPDEGESNPDDPDVKEFDSDTRKLLENNKTSKIRLSASEGWYGRKAGLQYPSRLSTDQYKTLKSDVEAMTSMFGSRAGYLDEQGEKELPDAIATRLDGPLKRDLQPGHKFDLASLKQIAENSSNDLFSEKRRLARAYPTFKLYFIEEDEFESRLLNYDDFYSYNGVKDFSVTVSRKTPGDVALITLQNVSGILDGTKRDAVVDLDYFSSTSKEGKQLAGDPVQAGTSAEQPYGSLVLRPGLNVQLRAGYSNDPDNLSVLINGRCVDVQWNQVGDTAQIMVQSFGTELLQILHGTDEEEDDIYHTTHQLLGALMLEPELAHFGRWEFGSLFMAGESKDARFDFHDYSKEAAGGIFENSTTAVKWFFRHPYVMYGLAIGGLALASRLPGSRNLFSKISRYGSRIGFVNKLLTKFGIVGAVGSEIFERQLVASTGRALTRAGQRAELVTAESVIAGEVAATRIAQASSRLATRSLTIGTAEAGATFGAARARAVQEAFEAIMGRFYREVPSTTGGATTYLPGVELATAGRLAQAMAQAEGQALSALAKGGWMSNPAGTATGFGMLSDIGKKPLVNILRGSTIGVSKLLLGAAGVGLAADAAELTGIPKAIYAATVGKAEKYFAAASVAIMLSPQDDNLYPPHPKDYMLIDRSWWSRSVSYATSTLATALTASDAIGSFVSHYFEDEDPYDKRAPVASYQYKVTNSYIWDVINEMALRHPGWIYGIRPYGKQFRYTLFFGVPSQRYWAVGADNLFISRANKLAKFIEGDVNTAEYRSLYGDSVDGVSLERIEADMIVQALTETISLDSAQKGVDAFAQGFKPRVGQGTNTIFMTPSNVATSGLKTTETGNKFKTAAEVVNDNFVAKLDALRAVTYTAKALEEYMHAVNLRFVPFRRYHSISSEVDLIWNGIIGSENATFNAVDVTYFNEDVEDPMKDGGPMGSTTVKVHAFLPENMLRVKALPPYINCRGYNMAMRYGMGDLLFTMRDMYRGEILTLGNPRIWPWDIVILQDTYNSMVGPVEVEQVVHTFSHETGYITEIKPSAVVLANEISSWPLLEAMKMVSLAVRNVEQDTLGLTAASFGSVTKMVDALTNNGPDAGDALANRKMKEIFGDYWDETSGFIGIDASTAAFGGNNNDPSLIPGAIGAQAINDVAEAAGDAISSVATVTAGVLGASALVVGGLALKFKIPLANRTVMQNIGYKVDIAATGILGATSAALITADYMMDPPQLMSLLGGSVLMLQCLRGDSIMLVPLMKNGYPIVAGLNYHDPSMIWKNFLGNLGRFADDVIGGTQELADLWSIYGTYAWRRLPGSVVTDSYGTIASVDTTGEQ